MQQKQLSREQVIEILRKKQGERTVTDFAKEIGVSLNYISVVYRGKADPGPSILKFLKLKAVQVYVAA